MLGNEEDFTAALGFEVEGVDANLSALDPDNFRRMIETRRRGLPELPGRRNDPAQRPIRVHQRLGRPSLYTGGRLYRSRPATASRSSTASAAATRSPPGSIYGFLAGKDPQWAVDCGAAHGALAMTTPGDTTMATLAEVERVMKGGAARVQR